MSKKVLTHNELVLEVLEAAGLNWTVVSSQLEAPSIELQDGKQSGSELMNYFANRRNDNGHLLSISSGFYVPLQNAELADVMVTAASEVLPDATKYRGGQLKDGELVYIQASLPDAYIGKSDIKRHITALNSHRPGKAIGFGTSNTVVVCQNTFMMASRDTESFYHTTPDIERVKIAANALRKTLRLEEYQMEVMTMMAEVELNSKHIDKMIASLFDVGTTKKAKEALSPRKQSVIDRFVADIDQSRAEQGDTLYALFNGVTRYTNHSLFKTHGDAQVSLAAGRGLAINQLGWDTTVSLLSKEKQVPVLV